MSDWSWREVLKAVAFLVVFGVAFAFLAVFDWHGPVEDVRYANGEVIDVVWSPASEEGPARPQYALVRLGTQDVRVRLPIHARAFDRGMTIHIAIETHEDAHVTYRLAGRAEAGRVPSP